MVDFLIISVRTTKRGVSEIYPNFIIKTSSDLMIRGGDFYAIWVEERGLWSTDEQDALQIIDRELDNYAEQNRDRFEGNVKVLHMWDASSGMIDVWHKYCQRQLRDSFHPLDDNLIFSNYETKKEDYASKKLSYPLKNGDHPAYDKLMSTLYSPEERTKIEWAIGSIITGDSKKIQKFLVLYGASGTGKSTVLNIIQKLCDGYYSVFDARALGSTTNAFALEAFKDNPLVAIQHDGDLSRIEDNTRLNSLVSHEMMTVNEKHKSLYATRFRCFLFMGTNKPVKITDAKSGLIRRLIDVTPSGNKLSQKEYDKAVKQIDFELGAIAFHCQEVYLENPERYDDYIPTAMLGASNDFYNFVSESFLTFHENDGTSLKAAWEAYKTYCEDAKVSFPLPKRVFKEELKNYFKEYYERYILEDGTRVRSYYYGFKEDRFEPDNSASDKTEKEEPVWLNFNSEVSLFDTECANCQAQYATTYDIPAKKWSEVTTKLSDLDTRKTHYVKIPEEHIVIDLDIPDDNGEKSFERNFEAACKWPATYAELSKSGKGIHLHYIYTGDPKQLSRIYSDHIEIKVFTGKSSLRRKLTKCNDVPIATISSGLPTKGAKKMVDFQAVKSEKWLRTQIKRNLNKEIHPNTKPSIDFINKLLNDAYEQGYKYDVTDMRNAILAFAAGSTNHSKYCIKLVNQMKFKSEDPSPNQESQNKPLIFFDVEVFPNLFLVNWKLQGEENKVVRMVNPTPTEIEALMAHKLVGFNCRRYDNHILYARLIGYTNEQLYSLSQKIITTKSKNCFFSEAYNVSYTDVYDFCAKKQSLKKWEIELGIHHQELGLPWDEPVPENMWVKVAEYCDYDVLATEAVFNARQADFEARKVLANIAGGTVNDTTNSLTSKLIFENNRHPQNEFVYTDLSTIFPGYTFDHGVSHYQGEETGEGGYVYSEPGMYYDIALLDIMSMHPHSAIALNIFGDRYTKRFKELVQARIAIKHRDFETMKTIFGGAFSEFVNATDEELSNLASALKIAINSVYGLTSATFDNPFRDPRNMDNIVAKRGALFMINLKHEVQKRGFTVAHIKTDSIKIPNATPDIIQFVMEYGKQYGYTFEHEATYSKMCLVNDAVYIAQYKDGKHAGEWTATGKQFQVPYVFKNLFSHEKIVFEDLCETRSVSTALYLDMNEDLEDVSKYEKELEDRQKGLKRRNPKLEACSDEDLKSEIQKGHNYIFVGRVGLFCPMKTGAGGGILLRQNGDKYTAAPDSKGYRWMESEMVKTLGKEGEINRTYYDSLLTDAIDTISKYGDFEQFAAETERKE